jgi:DNA helicase HerA-like ATPase
MANRHGLIAGATGTGKTVTLQVLAETFSQAGVPCFMADMKGDLSGISQAGQMSGFIEKRCAEFGIEAPQFQGSPVSFYDVFGEKGHPMRTTISNMGPELLSRLMELNEVQAGVMTILFKVADERGLLLLDLKDLRSMLAYISDHASELVKKYGNVSTASVGAIQRTLLRLEEQGAGKFFGEPAFDIMDLLQCRADGKGIMNVLAADRLMLTPKLYSTFLLWLLSELYVRLPEVGDQDLPRLVFFFDEAHTLFTDTPKSLVDKIEQVVRLIRSKGVGVYFVTQNPTDIPDSVLAQLGNRVQHALRAFTPKEQKNVRAAAETFRANPAFKTEDAIMELGTGEALVSFLDEKGTPTMVERAKVLFPLSQIGAITEAQREQIIKSSRIFGKYDTPIDRESAFEVLLAESEAESEKEEQLASGKEQEKASHRGDSEGTGKKSSWKKSFFGKIISAVITSVTAALGTYVANTVTGSKRRYKDSIGKKVTKTAVSTATRTATRELTRSILGNLK